MKYSTEYRQFVCVCVCDFDVILSFKIFAMHSIILS